MAKPPNQIELVISGRTPGEIPMGRLAAYLESYAAATCDTDPTYGPITQEHSHVYGVPISVGGKQPLANVNLQDGETVHYCEAPRELALKIAPLLFHHRIRAHDVGRYMRGRDGSWWMESFRIHELERLDERTLADTVSAMREDSVRRPLDRDILKLAGLRRG